MAMMNGSCGEPSTLFLRAARAGQLEKVLEYLDSGVDINTSNANGLNALHLAAKDGHLEIVKELLLRGAIVDAATKKGNTALHIASLAGQEEVVHLLVQRGASVNAQSQNGFTPLYMAAQENHDSVVKFLLNKGANQTLATEDGFTPLAVAMQQGHDKVVAVLLENDTRGKVRLPALHIAAKKDDCKAAALLLQNDHNPDVTSKSGFTPLHIAAHYGNDRIASLLYDKGADINFAAKHNITPMHVAAKWGKIKMVNLLMSKGANIEAKTRDGLTPLHCAARSGHHEVVDILIEKGAPIGSKTKNGLAPLHMASQGDHVDAARILLYHRAPVDEVTVDYLTALHVAAHCGHVRVAKLLLDRNADPNARALNGFTPLHIACKKNRIKVVELLLKHKASIEATTESGLTPLHVASFMGCMNIVIYLLQHEASPDIPTVRGETPLHLAARANQTDIIRILLRNGAQVDARAREEQTPLHVASRLGNVDIVMLLLQHGASVDVTTKDLYTPLHIAAKEGQEEVASVLLENGASLTSVTKKGFTPLHLAAKYGNMNVARLLLQKNAPVDAQGKNGVTPLHVASHYDHQNVALLLLDKGASPHAMAKNGHTPLHIAARKNQMDIATTLLEYGARANADSKAGFTPLHLSAQEGHTDMSTLLIEHKADTNQNAKNGLTPLHLCAQEDKVNVASILVKNGAQVNAKTKAGYTPLHVASHFGQAAMVRFLLSSGATVEKRTNAGYTPLHQAAQQGHTLVINLLLESKAQPNSVTNNGQTALDIAQKLGYITVVETLKIVTETVITTTHTVTIEEKYKVQAPESMQETFMSDSEDEGGEDPMLSDQQQYRYMTVDDMKSMGDDSMRVNVTDDERDHRHSGELSQLEDLQTSRIVRILTVDFPHYFAVVSRIRQEVHAVGPEGGTVSSTAVPQVQAIFPAAALTKKIRVGLQAHPIPAELVAKLLGNRVAVSPIVTVEPRRRKFHKPIILTIPVPQAANKGMINQYSGDAPTLRLLCSITGGQLRAVWEDVTGSTPLSFVKDCVSFTTTVSARFWLMDCRNVSEATKMATELYTHATHVPFMAKFVVFAKRTDPLEARLRVFCMTDDKEDKTLEHQEHFTEVAKSRDVEVLEGKTQFMEFAGNLVPVLKSGEQLQLPFRGFKENRVPFTVRVRDPDAQDTMGRIMFMSEPKKAKGEPPQTPICTLNIMLPEKIIPDGGSSELDLLELSKNYSFLRDGGLSRPDAIHRATIRLTDIANLLDKDWEKLAQELNITPNEITQIKENHPDLPAQQATAMFKVWQANGNKATGVKQDAEKEMNKLAKEGWSVVSDDEEKKLNEVQNALSLKKSDALEGAASNILEPPIIQQKCIIGTDGDRTITTITTKTIITTGRDIKTEKDADTGYDTTDFTRPLGIISIQEIEVEAGERFKPGVSKIENIKSDDDRRIHTSPGNKEKVSNERKEEDETLQDNESKFPDDLNDGKKTKDKSSKIFAGIFKSPKNKRDKPKDSSEISFDIVDKNTKASTIQLLDEMKKSADATIEDDIKYASTLQDVELNKNDMASKDSEKNISNEKLSRDNSRLFGILKSPKSKNKTKKLSKTESSSDAPFASSEENDRKTKSHSTHQTVNSDNSFYEIDLIDADGPNEKETNRDDEVVLKKEIEIKKNESYSPKQEKIGVFSKMFQKSPKTKDKKSSTSRESSVTKDVPVVSGDESKMSPNVIEKPSIFVETDLKKVTQQFLEDSINTAGIIDACPYKSEYLYRTTTSTTTENSQVSNIDEPSSSMKEVHAEKSLKIETKNEELSKGKDKTDGFLSGIFKGAKHASDEVVDEVKKFVKDTKKEAMEEEEKAKNLTSKMKKNIDDAELNILRKTNEVKKDVKDDANETKQKLEKITIETTTELVDGIHKKMDDDTAKTKEITKESLKDEIIKIETIATKSKEKKGKFLTGIFKGSKSISEDEEKTENELNKDAKKIKEESSAIIDEKRKNINLESETSNDGPTVSTTAVIKTEKELNVRDSIETPEKSKQKTSRFFSGVFSTPNTSNEVAAKDVKEYIGESKRSFKKQKNKLHKKPAKDDVKLQFHVPNTNINETIDDLDKVVQDEGLIANIVDENDSNLTVKDEKLKKDSEEEFTPSTDHVSESTKKSKDKAGGFLSGIFKGAKYATDEITDELKEFVEETKKEAIEEEKKVKKSSEKEKKDVKDHANAISQEIDKLTTQVVVETKTSVDNVQQVIEETSNEKGKLENKVDSD
ncbi:unnamed protein product, partial [Trichogramma brassicae]